ncbi:uncharacterized protein LOC125809387 [Solanum verrucosum]|uniref:uncharacterized protein LOC125809387 n=1 Tax=Solanum verrucosum TaxID=315347 RepID=UPI0020D08BBE|nr:uncharacterized protein LOC125809387 [Solanum verrucosum]
MTSMQTKASTNEKQRSAIIMERKDTMLEIAGTRNLKVTYLLLPITNNKKKKLGILRPLMQLKKLINKMSLSHVTLTKKRRLHSQLSRHKSVDYTVFHHYRAEVFCKIIDWQLQELNDCFSDVTPEFLYGVACLNPIDSFSSFDIQKIMRMTELYPEDFDELNMFALENQLANYIIDVRDINKRFSNLHGLCDLSKRLIQTKKHSCYPHVFRLVKFALLLPVATTSVKKAFSGMNFIKNELQSQMNDES